MFFYIYGSLITDSRIVWKTVGYIATGVGIVAAVAVPAVTAAVGFTTVGVAAGESELTIYMRGSMFVTGSAAAAAQAAIGNVAAGSFFAFMQFIGTTPLLVGAVSCLAGVLFVVLVAVVVRFFWKRRTMPSNY
jgi:hypothetical protein